MGVRGKHKALKVKVTATVTREVYAWIRRRARGNISSFVASVLEREKDREEVI